MMYLNTKEACLKWGVSERRVRELCQEGRVSNVIRSGKTWLIPADAAKPLNKKSLEKKSSEERLELYMNPVYCKNNLHSKTTYEEEIICQANNLFFEGGFEKAEQILNQMLINTNNDSYKLVAYMVLKTIYSINCRDKFLINEVTQNITELIARNPQFYYTKEFIKLYFNEANEPIKLLDIPQKFIPVFAQTVCVINVSSILLNKNKLDILEYELLLNSLNEEEQPGLVLYIHLFLAIYYNLNNEKDSYDNHIDKVLKIALPHKWYTPLAEYSYTLDWHEIKSIDFETYEELNKLSNRMIRNYISSGFFSKSIPPRENTDIMEIKVAYLIACKKSNSEISKILNLSLYRVKYYIKKIYSHTNTTSHDEIANVVKDLFKPF